MSTHIPYQIYPPQSGESEPTYTLAQLSTPSEPATSGMTTPTFNAIGGSPQSPKGVMIDLTEEVIAWAKDVTNAKTKTHSAYVTSLNSKFGKVLLDIASQLTPPLAELEKGGE